MQKIELDKNYYFDLVGQIQFDCIPEEDLYMLFRDGRHCAPLIEKWLTKMFPLIHVTGNKDHDHIDNENNQYDVKNFTKNGLKFMPSNQIGAGRSFDKEKSHEKAKKLIYIICDIVEFPKLTVRFIAGEKLIEKYPKCAVNIRERNVLFEYPIEFKN